MKPSCLSEPLLDAPGQAPDLPAPVPAPPSRRSSIAGSTNAARRLQRLRSKLWQTGVLMRLLTLLNAFALLGACGYSLWLRGFHELMDESIVVPARAQLAVHYALLALSGILLLALEQVTTFREHAARASIGLAFGASGRFFLFCFLTLVCTPAIRWDRSLYELYATGAAVAFLPLSGLLQAWLLSCAPEYRAQSFSELFTPLHSVDSNHFPQVYQRDDGGHLHLGVLLPGFASRESCTLSANCSTLTLTGEIEKIEAPFQAQLEHANLGPGHPIFGPFSREVQLMHPIDVTAPPESRMGLGILELRFQKGQIV